jgi:prepilin-type N-terminal cleavage/methylation domain-containing protein
MRMNVAKILRNQSGLTLVELLIGMVIGVIVLAAIFSSAITIRKSANFNFNQNYNVLEAKRALTAITDAFIYSSYAAGEVPAINTTAPSDNASFAVNGLTRRVYRVTTGTDANTVKIDYYNSSGAVSATRTIARQVNVLTFTRNSSASLSVVIRVGNTAHSQNPVMNSSTTITMPNYQ